MSKSDKSQAISTPEPGEHDKTKNIWQRMIAVQKAVKSVDKNELVQMKEGEKGYKAVTHDDVAAALHTPLADAGVFMLPTVTKYSFSDFEINGKFGAKKWYRTDIEILVKWINVDKPEEFIESIGAAYAMDSSDKSFAKAYSLALKIVLLKVHLLESRDGEEERQLEREYDETAKKQTPRNNPNQASTDQKKQGASAPAKTHSPGDFVMPINVGGTGGKALKVLDNETLAKLIHWSVGELAKEGGDKKHRAVLAQIESSARAVLKSRPEKTEPPPLDATEPLDKMPDHESDGADPGLYMIPKGAFEAIDELSGRPLKQISEKELRTVLKMIDSELQKGPSSAVSMVAGFEIKGKIHEFLKSMGAK